MYTPFLLIESMSFAIIDYLRRVTRGKIEFNKRLGVFEWSREVAILPRSFFSLLSMYEFD